MDRHPLILQLRWDSYLWRNLPKAVGLNPEVSSWPSERHSTRVLSNHASTQLCPTDGAHMHPSVSRRLGTFPRTGAFFRITAWPRLRT